MIQKIIKSINFSNYIKKNINKNFDKSQKNVLIEFNNIESTTIAFALFKKILKEKYNFNFIVYFPNLLSIKKKIYFIINSFIYRNFNIFYKSLSDKNIIFPKNLNFKIKLNVKQISKTLNIYALKL